MISTIIIDGFALRLLGVGGASIVSLIVVTALKKSTPFLRFLTKCAAVTFTVGLALFLLNKMGLVNIPDFNMILDNIIDNIFGFFTPMLNLNL